MRWDGKDFLTSPAGSGVFMVVFLTRVFRFASFAPGAAKLWFFFAWAAASLALYLRGDSLFMYAYRSPVGLLGEPRGALLFLWAGLEKLFWTKPKPPFLSLEGEFIKISVFIYLCSPLAFLVCLTTASSNAFLMSFLSLWFTTLVTLPSLFLSTSILWGVKFLVLLAAASFVVPDFAAALSYSRTWIFDCRDWTWFSVCFSFDRSSLTL